MDFCPYCNSSSVILDVERGEYVCTRCGTVIARVVEYFRPEYRIFSFDEVEIGKIRTEPTPCGELGSMYSVRQMILLNYKPRTSMLKSKRFTMFEIAGEIVKKLNISIDISELLSDIDVQEYLTYAKKMAKRYISDRILLAGLILKLIYVRHGINVFSNISKIARELRISDGLTDALAIASRYLSSKYGRNFEIESIVDKLIVTVPEEYRYTVKRIVLTLLKESSILKTFSMRRIALAACLIAVICEKLSIPYDYNMLVDILARSGCSVSNFKNRLYKVRKMVHVELADG